MTTGSGISQRHHDTDGPPVAQEVEKDDGHQSAASFKALKHALNPDTYKAITESPFKHTEMTPVQEAVLSLLPDLANPYQPSSKTKPARDLLVRARTGTGKTLAFLVPAIEARLRKIDEYAKQAVADAGLNSDKALETRAARSFAQNHVGALIISPTRELATQIANEALKLTHHHRGFEVRLLVGGASRGAQLRDWMRGRLDIVVATPGRLRDLMQSEQGVAQAIAKTPVVSFPLGLAMS
jgi:ATP-dependent RNA helicase MSS116